MAFKPIIKEKEIKGKVYKAQFNGIAAALDAIDEAGDSTKVTAEYLFAHVLVEPKITDIDEYFGIDFDLFNEVTAFASKVMKADPEYFRDTAEEEATGKGKK